VQVGLFAAAGGLYRLPGRIGFGKAMELALTADPMTADDALTYGLINRLTGRGETVAVALELARRIARNAPLAVAASKDLIRRSAGETEAAFWELQKESFERVFNSDD